VHINFLVFVDFWPRFWQSTPPLPQPQNRWKYFLISSLNTIFGKPGEPGIGISLDYTPKAAPPPQLTTHIDFDLENATFSTLQQRQKKNIVEKLGFRSAKMVVYHTERLKLFTLPYSLEGFKKICKSI